MLVVKMGLVCVFFFNKAKELPFFIKLRRSFRGLTNKPYHEVNIVFFYLYPSVQNFSKAS
jgi:hypothetical protein